MSAIIKDNLKLVTNPSEVSMQVDSQTTADSLVAANEDNQHMKILNTQKKSKSARAVNIKTPAQIKTMEFLKTIIPPTFGILLFLAVWTLISHLQPVMPGPISTWHSAVELFSHPFHQNSLDDQGIGWNILSSLERVALGFGLAALVGIPLGFMIGRYEFISRMTAPVIGLLRPVSPLAWLPLGLLVLKAAGPAAIWVILFPAFGRW